MKGSVPLLAVTVAPRTPPRWPGVRTVAVTPRTPPVAVIVGDALEAVVSAAPVDVCVVVATPVVAPAESCFFSCPGANALAELPACRFACAARPSRTAAESAPCCFNWPGANALAEPSPAPV